MLNLLADRAARDAAAGAAVTLGSGLIVMLPVLPMVRAAVFMFFEPRPVIIGTLTLEAGVSLMMLVGRIRCRRLSIENRIANTVARAIRTRNW